MQTMKTSMQNSAKENRHPRRPRFRAGEAGSAAAKIEGSQRDNSRRIAGKARDQGLGKDQLIIEEVAEGRHNQRSAA
jgi:hypothetical protein